VRPFRNGRIGARHAPIPQAPARATSIIEPDHDQRYKIEDGYRPTTHPRSGGSPGRNRVERAPEPGAPNFVDVGAHVSEGQTLLIIEAMKTMNHIPAPRSGTVTAILCSNEQPVEFGEPLVIIE
jgi:acetyl-CoA carboxylase biotin carboxyl carrier protein